MRTMDVTRSLALAAVLVGAAYAGASADPGRRIEPAPPQVPCSSRLGRLEFQPPALSQSRFATFSAVVSVTCASATPFRLTLSSANGCRLRTGRQTVSYVLFLDAAGTKPLLDCGPEKLSYTGKGSGAFLIYGRTSAVRTFSGDAVIAAGTYTDGIDVEVETP